MVDHRETKPIRDNVTHLQGGFWEDYLRSSINVWEKLAGETGITFRSGQEQEELIRRNVRMDGTHASLENTEAIAHLSLTDPLYKVRIFYGEEKTFWRWIFFRHFNLPCSTSARSKSGLTTTAGSSERDQFGKMKSEPIFWNVLRLF